MVNLLHILGYFVLEAEVGVPAPGGPVYKPNAADV